MTELLIIFQLHTDKKTTIVSDMIIPVPKGLSNTELMNLIKTSLAAIEGAGAVLNIINLNSINAPKVEVVKDYTPRPERPSFGPRKDKSYGNKRFSRGEGRPSARYGGHTARPTRDDSRPFREDSRPFREDSKGGHRPNKPSGGYGYKPTGGGFHKGSKPFRPSRSR